MTTHHKITGRAIEILHVEDNFSDSNILKQVLKMAGFAYHLTSVNTGEAALDLLNRRNAFATASQPDVVLLDLKLPGKDGLGVLNEIRHSPLLQNIPVIVLTGSESGLDMSGAEQLKADHYMTKPMELEGYKRLTDLLRKIWMKTFTKRSF